MPEEDAVLELDVEGNRVRGFLDAATLALDATLSDCGMLLLMCWDKMLKILFRSSSQLQSEMISISLVGPPGDL